MYQRVMLINRIATPKSPAALQDRAEEALGKIGYAASEGVPHGDEAFGLSISLDYARYLASTSSEPDLWSHLRGSRPRRGFLVPEPARVRYSVRQRASGHRRKSPLNIAGMTLLVLDASGRLSEFVAVLRHCKRAAVSPPPVDWKILFDTAALDKSRFRAVESEVGAGHVRRSAVRLGGGIRGAAVPDAARRGGIVCHVVGSLIYVSDKAG